MDGTHRLSNGGDQTEEKAGGELAGHCEQSHGFRAEDEAGAEAVAQTSLVFHKTISPQGPGTAPDHDQWSSVRTPSWLLYG